MKPFFKGYYFKCSTDSENIAFIPALHQNGKLRSASLQVITENKTYTIPYQEITFGKKDVKIKLGKSYFTERGMILDVNEPGCRIYGKVRFCGLQRLKYDIMGPFHSIPCMQCVHSVISMTHSVAGRIWVNGKEFRFADGIGYIEGDRGCSFPKEYLWTQCHFGRDSVMLSVADIPFLGFHFTGIIAVIILKGKEYRLATYLGARVKKRNHNMVEIEQGNYRLTVTLLETREQKLSAPVKGRMSRTIRESISCKAWYCFRHGKRVLMEFVSEKASFENMYVAH